jgi:hypothetical protein
MYHGFARYSSMFVPKLFPTVPNLLYVVLTLGGNETSIITPKYLALSDGLPFVLQNCAPTRNAQFREPPMHSVVLGKIVGQNTDLEKDSTTDQVGFQSAPPQDQKSLPRREQPNALIPISGHKGESD